MNARCRGAGGGPRRACLLFPRPSPVVHASPFRCLPRPATRLVCILSEGWGIRLRRPGPATRGLRLRISNRASPPNHSQAGQGSDGLVVGSKTKPGSPLRGRRGRVLATDRTTQTASVGSLRDALGQSGARPPPTTSLPAPVGRLSAPCGPSVAPRGGRLTRPVSRLDQAHQPSRPILTSTGQIQPRDFQYTWAHQASLSTAWTR